MSCKCGGKNLDAKTSRKVQAFRKLVRARAAACQLCIHAQRHPTKPWREGAVACGISGAPIAMLVNGRAPCPKGRFPDKDGITRRYWLRWFNVPFPDRIILRLFHRKKPAICKAYDGCGCIVPVKNAASKVPLLRRLSLCRVRA